MSNLAEETFSTQPKIMKAIFSNDDSYYKIPNYQRPYSWTREEVEILWDDISQAIEDKEESYFLGSLILVKSDDEYYEVIDGQQRLTTLMILFCVIRDLFLKDNKKLNHCIRSVTEDKNRIRVITQINQQNLFDNEIIKTIKFPPKKLSKEELRTLSKKNRYLHNALIFKELTQNFSQDKINLYLEYILNKVLMISIICSTKIFAVKLFRILNTRGLDLSSGDLFKSFLYTKLKPENTQQFIESWNEINTLIKEYDMDLDNLLIWYAYYLLERKTKREVTEELEVYHKNNDPNKVIYDFKKFVDNNIEIEDTEDNILYSFFYLRHEFWRPILISANLVNYEKFSELLFELRKFYYSYWIAGFTSQKVRDFSFRMIKIVKDKVPIKEIRQEINNKLERDNVFERMVENLESDVYGQSWAKSLLTLVEYDKTDESILTFIEFDKNIHIDHILPVKWGEVPKWRSDWNKEDAEEALNTIGNLTLLSGIKNIKASNKPFEEKRDIYLGKKRKGKITSFVMSQEVARLGKWTIKDWEKRQKQLNEDIINLFYADDTPHKKVIKGLRPLF